MKEYEKPIVMVIDFSGEEIMDGESGEVDGGFSGLGGGTSTNPYG